MKITNTDKLTITSVEITPRKGGKQHLRVSIRWAVKLRHTNGKPIIRHVNSTLSFPIGQS